MFTYHTTYTFIYIQRILPLQLGLGRHHTFQAKLCRHERITPTTTAVQSKARELGQRVKT
jgi:hypothetical protein